MNAKQKSILLLGDLIIPLFGYYSLDWSLYFIALYYLLDILGLVIFYQIKARQRLKFINQEKENKTHIKQSFLFVGLSVAIGVLVHLFSSQIYPGINFSKEFVDFLMYEEEMFPFPQVYVLLPLVLLPQYQLYKMEFLQFAKYRKNNIKDIAESQILSLVSAVILLFILFIISTLITLDEKIWLFLFLTLEILYKYLFNIKGRKHFLLTRK